MNAILARDMSMLLIKRYSLLLLMLGISVSCLLFAQRYRYISDWTQVGKHSLTQASQDILANLDDQLSITGYFSRSHRARESAGVFIERYQRHQPSISFQLVDPASEPQHVRDNDIEEGDIVINYAGRSERVRKLSEQAFSSALARLARNEQRYVVFVSGHGERNPNREANHDVSAWVKVLRARGLNVQELNLSSVQAIPDNTSTLVVASPQLAYLNAEFKLLARYISRGGNLLWLSDPEEPVEMKALADILGVEKLPGTLIDPSSLANGLDNPALLLTTKYADHPATKGFNLTSLLVYASACNLPVASSTTCSSRRRTRWVPTTSGRRTLG
ncbi:MAG: GldG family protein, partial [Pseudomonadota bacterium]